MSVRGYRRAELFASGRVRVEFTCSGQHALRNEQGREGRCIHPRRALRVPPRFTQGLGGWALGDSKPRTCGLRIRARLRLTAQGSRRGPVNERATTRNYGVARERKHTAHGLGSGNAAGQRSESSYLAKVGVAGSNPVVRSRETADQGRCEPALSLDGWRLRALGVTIGSRSVRDFVTWKGRGEREEGCIWVAVAGGPDCHCSPQSDDVLLMDWRCGPWTDEASRDILGGISIATTMAHPLPAEPPSGGTRR